MSDKYRITITWDHDKKIIGWYGFIYKNDWRWKLISTYSKTRKGAMLKALDMIQEDGAIIKQLNVVCEEES